MRIAGYQPLSLIDYPGVISSVVFTQGCAFRCPYCHNPELIPHGEGVVRIDDVLKHIDMRSRMLEGVCITGGEPTIQAGLRDFLIQVKQRGMLIKLDTNGIHPNLVREFMQAGLIDYIAMDLKHTWERYDEVARTGSRTAIDNCRKTFDLLQASSLAHEFRTTVSPALHSEDELVAMAVQLTPGSRYALQKLRYGKMLDPRHPVGTIDLERVAMRIKNERPDVEISVR